MNYIKLYEEYKNNLDIPSICREYGIENYIINDDGSVDVNGNVVLSNKKLMYIPIKFNIVRGSFVCSYNGLSNLDNTPREVLGNFDCSYNVLNDLIGGPVKVTGEYRCYLCGLKSLEGSPEKSGNFFCNNNNLETLKGSPITTYTFDCSNNDLYNLKYAPTEFTNFICKGNIKLPNRILFNTKIINDIVKLQDEYGIWDKDGKLNNYRFEELLKDIKK